MSLRYCYPNQEVFSNPFFHLPTGSMNNFDYFYNRKMENYENIQLPRRRRDDTNSIITKLHEATWIRRPGEHDLLRLGGRKNKNEILGLTNARLIKEKYLNGDKYLRDVQLVQGLQSNYNNGEFLLVLRSDGRIIAMTDEIEQHLAKSMRSLYTQCTNIFTCLDQFDGEKLRQVLNGTENEYRLVCTLRLPKGKRPSRTREDVKTISMAGHFYCCHERLFIARCETLVSCHVNNGSNSSSSPIITNTTTKLILNDDMTINIISSNARDLLGYSRNEMIGQWFGRFVSQDALEKFQRIRDDFLYSEQQMANNYCDLFDFYVNHGERRLTFFCQIRPMRERRSKSIKFSIVAQLIDPSIRAEYSKHIQGEPVQIKVEPTHQASPRTNEDRFIPDSPTLDMGLLISGNEIKYETRSNQSSPSARSLSNGVAPFTFDGESIPSFHFQPEVNPMLDENLLKTTWADDLASIDALMNEF